MQAFKVFKLFKLEKSHEQPNMKLYVGERTLYLTGSYTVTFASRTSSMQLGCVFNIFGSDTYRTPIPNTKWRRSLRSWTGEDKLPFSGFAVQFHCMLLDMSHCI